MIKVKQIKRKQRLPDHAFIQAVRTKLAFFIKDKARFIIFDSDFADPFAANWKAQIDAAEAEPSKKNLSDESIQLTEAVEEQMELCRAKWSDAKYYIKKAFPKNPAKLESFGNSRFRKARRVPHLMISFMNVFAKACDKNRAELNANGYTNDDIAEIDMLAKALEAISITQQNFISAIPSATNKRITTFNTAHYTMTKVCKAAKIIFKNNYAKRRRYLLPVRKHKTEIGE